MMRNRKATGRAVAFLLQCRAAEEKSAACFLVLHGKLGKGYKKGCKKSTDDF